MHPPIMLQIKLNERVRQSLTEIYLMSQKVVQVLLDVVRLNMGCLYRLSEALSRLDLLVALRSYAANNDTGMAMALIPKFGRNLRKSWGSRADAIQSSGASGER